MTGRAQPGSTDEYESSSRPIMITAGLGIAIAKTALALEQDGLAKIRMEQKKTEA